MLYHSVPDELRITWIDPKKVEATAYKALPYCPIDPVTDMGDAYGMLSYLVWEMKKRYKMLEWSNVKNISEYNEKVETMSEEAFRQMIQKAVEDDEAAKLAAEKFHIYDKAKMRYWILVIDEYANLATEAKEAEDQIKTLAAMSRAAGIHIILATQRPSVDVISGTLKSNIPSKIALSVSSETNSMIILDHGGAEKLLGHGDSIVAFNGEEEVRCQGCYISNDEIEKIFAHLRKTNKPDYLTASDSVDGDGNPITDEKTLASMEEVAKPTSDVGAPFIDDSEEFYTLPDGTRRIDYMKVVTNPELCALAEYREAMCDWAPNEEEAMQKRPWERHVKPHSKSRRF